MDLRFVDELSKVRILIAGEVGIDEYIWGETRRISPEAPVPVVEVDSVSHRLGLAGNVAQNTASLGAHTTLVTVRGKDADGEKLAEMLKSVGVSQTIFTEDATRPTLRKVRVVAQKQHMVRVDYERSHLLGPGYAKNFTDQICDEIPKSDGMILQDYGKGIWNPDTMVFLKQAKAYRKPVFVDPNRNTALELYRGVDLLTPNVMEAETLCRVPNERSKVAGQNDTRLLALARKISDTTEAGEVVITCGEFGMVSLTRGENHLSRIPTFARDVFDVTGAGDTVIGVLALMKCLGYPLSRCMQVANAAAGLVVAQVGAASVTPAQLKEELARLADAGLLRD